MSRIAVTLLTLCLLTASLLASPSAPPVRSVADVDGDWVGTLPVPGQVELERFEMNLARTDDGVRGSMVTGGRKVELRGTFDAETGRLTLTGSSGAQSGLFELRLEGETLTGTLELWGGQNALSARRLSGEAADETELVVDFSVERPKTLLTPGLPAALSDEVDQAIRSLMNDAKVVGLSAAFVVEGNVIDVRSFGWEDFGERVPASDETRYRWASISKPLTAIAALQLAGAGALDLDLDVREYVPEFPEKRWPITTRQLLCHQSGVVHYRDMRVRTFREYDVPHPWADRVLALDMFNESPLLFEPGSAYSYTTPGYALLGAVIERSGGARYAEQVRVRICKPLGMATMQPDYPWVDIPHRSRGYHHTSDGRVVDSGDNNIAWKLPAGGWISNVIDLARFGAGLMSPKLLPPDLQLEMWRDQELASGEATGSGLGIGLGLQGDVRTLSHSGGQLKTSTFLLVAPDHGAAVALMCNTQGTGLGGLAEEILPRLVAAELK